jgi:hypothetical protein
VIPTDPTDDPFILLNRLSHILKKTLCVTDLYLEILGEEVLGHVCHGTPTSCVGCTLTNH